jgi:hypothetical protein
LNTGTPRPLMSFTGMLFVPAPARPIARTLSGIFIVFISCERTRIASGRAPSFAIRYASAGKRFRPTCEIELSTRISNFFAAMGES